MLDFERWSLTTRPAAPQKAVRSWPAPTVRLTQIIFPASHGFACQPAGDKRTGAHMVETLMFVGFVVAMVICIVLIVSALD